MQVHRIGMVSNNQSVVPKPVSTKISHKVNQKELSNVPFYGAVKLNANAMNIQQKRNKLVKLIDSILEVISLAEMPPKEYSELEYRKMITYTHQLFIRKDKLFEKLVELENPKMTNSERMMLLAHYDAEAKKLKNALPVYREQPVIDAKISALDTTLLSKFKNALLDDDYNLGKIFEEHFAPLAGILTVAELQEKYPRMILPQNPYDVVADKLLSTLTRDFYETFDEFDEKGDFKGCDAYVDKTLNSVFEANAPLLGATPEQAYIAFADQMIDKIIEKHERILDEEDPTSFSSIPIHRKTDKAPITAGDVKLLGVDFDDYVTSVIREIYLDKKKPNEIIYSNEEQTFSVNSIADSAYKFDKISERIKTMIADAAKIQKLQRNYDKFDNEELKSRLNFYANKEIAENNVVFENIVNFYGCNFDKEDIACLKLFLKALDSVYDGKMSVTELEKGIQAKELIPKGTERVNQQELEEISQKYRAEQQLALKLSALKNKFDDAMNTLYQNGMSNCATSLSKYRPEALTSQAIENVDYICDKLTENLKGNGVLKGKERLESTLLSWDTYNFYKDCDGGKEIIANAETALLHEYGSSSPELIGQYLLCNDIIEDYPKSMNYYKQPELLERIIEKADGDKTLAKLYLAKYEDYLVWEDSEKSQLTELLAHFDNKNPVGKMILKQVMEDDYINLETTAQVDFNGNGKNLVTAKIASNVKQEIMDKYKFPVCINYLVAFEEALSKVAASSDSAGIKQTGTNNQQLQYKMELKVNAYRDRLFSSNNDYNFDVYSEKGLH